MLPRQFDTSPSWPRPLVVVAVLLAAGGPGAVAQELDKNWMNPNSYQEEDRKNPNCVRSLVRGNDLLGDMGYGKITDRYTLIASAAQQCKMDPDVSRHHRG